MIFNTVESYHDRSLFYFFLIDFGLSKSLFPSQKNEIKLRITLILIVFKLFTSVLHMLKFLINDGGDFRKLFTEIYPSEMEHKIEHKGTHAAFLDLDIANVDHRCAHKLYDKRDNFNFFIVRKPHMSSNIPWSVLFCFYAFLWCSKDS